MGTLYTGLDASRLRAPAILSFVLALVVGLLSIAPAVASPNGVVISELRFRGPAGGNDEFVELLNTASTPVDVSGWTLRGCNSTGAISTRATIPAGTKLDPGQHYLFTNNASGGYSGTVSGDAKYGTGITDTGGVRLVAADGSTVVDQAGSTGGNPCREGDGLRLPTANGENAFERLDDGSRDADDNAADFEGPKTAGPQSSGSAPTPPTPTITSIHDIQGSGQSSPKDGQEVTIEGVVTGVDDEIGANFERTFPEDAGIFVQEEDSDVDSDPNTSEGIFVGFVRDRAAYPPGTKVRLNGRVNEKFDQTIISETFNQEPRDLGDAPLPAPVTIDQNEAESQDPATRPYYERLEGMRVGLETGTANSGGTNKFGELFLTPGSERDRVFRTETLPALLAIADDAGAGDPSNPFRPEFVSRTQVQADLFDQVNGAAGPFGFSFGNYKIMVQEDLEPEVVKGPTPYPYNGVEPAGEYQLRVASFNVENFFEVGAELDLGNVTEEEYTAKRDRLADAIGRLLQRPDVVALQEVSNQAVLDDLANKLGGYRGYTAEGNDSRGIDVAFLVKDGVEASNFRQLGKDAQGPSGFDCSDVEGGLFDRPPVAIDVTGGGDLGFTIFSNHFSSKAAPDECRAAQATFVRDRVKEVEDAGGQAIVAGDLNSFEDEVALDTLQDGTTTLTNQWSKAPAEERYSFQFDGKLQTLDHALITDGLDVREEGFLYDHIDNDYFRRNDPNDPTQPHPSDGHQASDHDPMVLTLSTSVCPGGDERPTIVVGNTDTGVPNRDIGGGCTVNDLLPRPDEFRNLGAYISRVSQIVNKLVAQGVLTSREKGSITRAAAKQR